MTAVAVKDRPAGLGKVRLETLEEGRCVQTLHTGPYDEAGVLADMHDHFIPEAGLRMSGSRLPRNKAVFTVTGSQGGRARAAALVAEGSTARYKRS